LSTLGTAAVSTGTWTPTVDFATTGDLSVSYTDQTGRYIKIGPWVFTFARVRFTPTFSTASGNFQVKGLPFTVRTGGEVLTGGGILFIVNDQFSFPAGSTSAAVAFNSNSNAVNVRGSGSGVNTIPFRTDELTSGGDHNLGFCGFYEATS
jgi:hypothetical protein